MILSSVRRCVGVFPALLGLLLLVGQIPGGDSPVRREAGQNPAARRTGAKPFAADRFVRAFRSASDEAKLAALLEVEQRFRDHPDLPESLWQAIQPARDGKKVTPALLAGVRLYAGIADAKQSDRQLHLLQSADARVVLAAAEGLAGRQAPEALAPIAALRLRPEYAQRYGFRLAVLSAVAKYPQPAAVDWLIETLSESDGQLKYEAARELARLTGENFGGRSDDWQKWWADHRAEFAAAGPASPRPEAAVPAEMPWDESVPKFFNVPIYARRVVFVIDRSRSMQSSVDAVTRLDDAQRELELAVHGLPDGTLFNLVAYDTTLRLWRDRLVPADLKSRSESLRFIYSLYPDNKTACYDALEGALALDPNLELIVFLSDGEPTAGRITDPAQIVREITARNAASRVRIDVLGIDAQGQTEKFLKELAAANFGKYRAVR